jgi:hypothetical protein
MGTNFAPSSVFKKVKMGTRYNQKNYSVYDKILENPYTTHEIMHWYLGDLIGEGASRWVFDYNDDLVLKVEKGDWMSNAIEYDTWVAVQDTKWAKWFAPIVDISDNGRLLWQKKCKKVYEQPKKLPSFFSDVKLSNLGELNGRIVAVDYSINKLIEAGMKGAKLLKPKSYIKE